jgi:predicted component of type VI protein secretion system
VRVLRIHVHDSDSGRSRDERYSRSPVRVGRNPRNDLCLSFGFVSGWHAKIEWDENGGAFTDLGSTNGSVIGGRRVEANQAYPIGNGLSVTIGKLEMRFSFEESDAVGAHRSGSYDQVQGAPTRVPRAPTMPIQAVSDGPEQIRDPHMPSTVQGGLRDLMGGPPPLQGGGPPAFVGGPPSLDGPPPLQQARFDGPPPLSGPAFDGPPPLQRFDGPPMFDGPPPLGGGPPPLGGGPPPLGGPPSLGGPPRLDSGGMPPPLTDGPPSLGGPPSLDPRSDTEPPRPPRPSGAEATGFVDLGGVHRAIRELRPAYEEFERARQIFQQQVDASIAKIPANTRDTAMAFLRREFPNMPGATPFAAVPVVATGASNEGSTAVTNFAAALLHDVSPPGTADEQSAFLGRIAEILQTTAQAFVEIRNVQARFGEEMGVRTIREYTPLHAAGDARGVLDYLLDFRRGGPERNAQLSAVYSDFMLHQVALINGVVDGVEGLMEQFRPAEIERGVGGLSKAAGAWKKYTERYAEVIEERGIAALVFGPEFARAYTRVGNG